MGFRLGGSFVDFCMGFCTRAQETRGKKLFTGSYGSFGLRCTDGNDNKELSYPYKRSVDSTYTT